MLLIKKLSFYVFRSLFLRIVSMNACNVSINLINDLEVLGSAEKAKHLQRFFKTGVGEYAQGDIFWGITVPQVRTIARTYKNIDINYLEQLLEHEVHEVRLCALLIMVLQSKAFPDQMYDLYLKKTKYINNWDLVDLSAPAIVGDYVYGKDCTDLYRLANSDALWEKRIAIVSTFAFIKKRNHEYTFEIAKILMHDKHDLIHKATGWMLREVGKRCSMKVLEEFLEQHAHEMPRTALRYSIEHMPIEIRRYYLEKKRT
jgi:3-methyladenine DNA glycosylase AlkD